jgi:hypothetical protein
MKKTQRAKATKKRKTGSIAVKTAIKAGATSYLSPGVY